MRLEIDIAEHHYNNIMALDSVSLGRVPYKGIIMYTINAIKHGKVLEQEPTTKNDIVTLTFSKGTLKYSCKDYVVYKKDWLRSHYGAEIDIMFGDSQYKETTTKNDLGVDCIDKSTKCKHKCIDNNLGVDCISRDQALEAIDTWDKFGYSARYGLERLDKDDKGYVPYVHYEDIVNCIKNLPSVTPQYSSELEKNSKKLEKDFGELDCISRKAVIDGIKEYFHDEYYQRTSIQDCRDSFIEDVLNNLPSVTPQLSVPEVTALAEWTEKLTKANEDAYNKGYADGMKAQEPKTGEWIEHFDESGKWYECDQCHTDWGGAVNFCPNCGADMREVEE